MVETAWFAAKWFDLLGLESGPVGIIGILMEQHICLLKIVIFW